MTVESLFSEAARSFADAVALVTENAVVTYRELDERADLLARRFRAAGAGPGNPVAVVLPRSSDAVAATLGSWRTGAACVPIDPLSPRTQIDSALEVSGAAVVFAEDGLFGRRGETPPAPPPDAPGPALHSAAGLRTAYIFFTSGSTGVPKGVEVPHQGIVNEAFWTRDRYGLGPGSRGTWLSSPGFAISRWELWSYLTCGAAVSIAAPGTEWSAPGVRDWFTETEPTSTILVTSLGEELLAYPWPTDTSLRLMILGGEKMRRLPDEVPFTVVNSYGVTEASGVRLTAVLTSSRGGGEPALIGEPIANTRVHVLDERGEPVPPGETGELYIGGQGLANGYTGNPALTAERFVADPFGADGGRMYRTGDLVRAVEGAGLIYVARAGTEQKVKGARVDPQAVETVLLEHGDVGTAMVAALPGPGNEVELTAFIVPRGDRTPEPHELRGKLAATLPRHMVPTRFLSVRRIPLLMSGKTDRTRLPDDPVEMTDARNSPIGETEELIHGVIGRLLDVERLGVHDDFFALGGGSLQIARLRVELEERLGVPIDIADLFTRRTVADAATLVERVLADDPGPTLGGTASEGEGRFPLTGFQQGIWSLSKADPGDISHIQNLALTIRGECDAQALEKALNAVIREQDLMRARFQDTAAGPVCDVLPTAGLELPVVDLSGSARASELGRLLAEDLVQPFDLEQAPLLRAQLHRLAPDEHVLRMAVHHIIWDGESAEIMLHELARCYDRALDGAAPAERQPPAHYSDYARRERSTAQGDQGKAALAHWRNELAGVSASSPVKWQGTASDSRAPHVGVVGESGGGGPIQHLDGLATRARVTASAIGLTAFAVALHQHSDADEFVVLIPVSLRSAHESRTIGPCMNMVPLRFDFGERVRGVPALTRTTDLLHAALQHSAVPFSEVVRELRPSRGSGSTPYGQHMFGVNRMPDDTVAADGGLWSLDWLSGNAPKAHFSLTLNERRDGWSRRVEHDTRYVTAEDTRKVLETFDGVLERLVAEPEGDLVAERASAAAVPAASTRDETVASRWDGGATGEEGPAQDQVHRFLRHSWAEVLDVADVPDDADFIGLGGHSLAAVRLANRIDGEFGVRIPVQDIFDSPSFRDFAAQVVCAAVHGKAGEDHR